MPLGGAVQARPTLEQEVAKFKGFSVNEGETITPDKPEDLNPVKGKNMTAKEQEALDANTKKPATELKVVPVKLTDEESEKVLVDAEAAKGSELTSEEEALALETATSKKNAAASKKTPASVQDRINKSIKAQRAAERRADAAEAANKGLETRLAALEAGRNATPLTDGKKSANNDSTVEPDVKKYEYGELDTKYIRDLARWEARQEIADAAKNQDTKRQSDKQAAATAEFEALMTTFTEAGSEAYDDFDEVVIQGAKDKVWELSDSLGAALLTSDFGTQIAYDLASDPKEAKRIAKLPIGRQLAWLGRKEAELEAAGTGAKTEAEKAADAAAKAAEKASSSTVKESKAPAPVTRARGNGSNSSVSGDTQDFAAFEAQWREQNKR